MPADRFPIVGIVGGGQLARMTVQASIALGVHVRVLAEHADDSAALVTPHVDIGDPDAGDALRAFAATCDVMTLDHELVNIEALAILGAMGRVVRPGPATLRFAKDKLYQRTAVARAGLPVPAFADAPDRAAIGVSVLVRSTFPPAADKISPTGSSLLSAAPRAKAAANPASSNFPVKLFI